MRKILVLIIGILLIASTSWATTYYGGAAGKDINADDLWYEAVTGSCAGSGSPVAWSTVGSGANTLIANGCTIAIPNTSTQTFTATKISNKTDGGSNVVDGGQFTYTTSSTETVTLQASIETGGTTGACLAISGSGNPGTLRDVFIIGSSGTPVTITGGSASSMYGVNDNHTGANARVTAYASATSGAHASGHAYYRNATTGSFTLVGNATGVGGNGLVNNGTATATIINGDCIAGTGYTSSSGCVANNGRITATGNLVNSSKAVAISGYVEWTPSSAQKYIKIDGGGTAIYASAGLGSDVGGTQISAANTAAKVSDDSYFVKKDDGVYTKGTMSASGSGGGSWGF